MSTQNYHHVELKIESRELHRRFTCTAPEDAPCRRRPKDHEQRESWTRNESTETGFPCRAVDWVNAVGIDWDGHVWLNPPYSFAAWTWLAKLAEHGDGIALVFARTETAGFVREVWGKATGLLFLHGRLHFHYADGERAAANSGAPSVLVAYGERAAKRLMTAEIEGTYVPLAAGVVGQEGEPNRA